MNSVLIDGKKCLRKNGLKTFLVVGLDQEGEAVTSDSYNNLCDADFVLLVVFDTADKTITPIEIDRDTICYIQMLGVNGRPYGKYYMQLAYSYTFGDGLLKSLENTALAVSDLFYGIEIDYMVSMRLGAVPALVDFLGGFPLYFDEDYTELDPRFTAGNKILMDSGMMINFLRARTDLPDHPTNEYRMQRQRLFLDQLMQWIQTSRFTADFLADAYTSVEKYCVSNLSYSSLLSILDNIDEYDISEVLTPAGEYVEAEYMEFYPDEESLTALAMEYMFDEIN